MAPLTHCVALILCAVVGRLHSLSTGCTGNGRIITENQVSVCKGSWSGHIRNATSLCAPGWGVCSHKEQHLLRRIQWKQATAIPGCYAINAAHDGGRCRECGDTMDQDDLGGIGQHCPHQNFGQTSCIQGGRIDASCCVDAHFHTACHQTNDITGVVCCKVKGQKPHILARPQEKLLVKEGKIFLLSCQASGSPHPRIHWYKDGRQISDGGRSRVSVLSSGDLLFTLAKRSDTGLYSCEVVNEHGMDMASTKVIIEDPDQSGCRRGSSDGIALHRDVHACKGRWEGHVRKGRSLCQRGWRVCSPKDRVTLHHLSWLDVYDLKGCYAYNAANSRGKCQRCTNGRMAGVGRYCGRMRYSKSSCLAQGMIDVFKPKDKVDSCSYKEGVTTGVLCCRKKKQQSVVHHKPALCTAKCENGGVCIKPNVCQCKPGYKGATCHIAICEGGCGSFATCIKPGKCKCKEGYVGKNCRKKAKHECLRFCMKSCPSGKCTCPKYGRSCTKVLWMHRNRTNS